MPNWASTSYAIEGPEEVLKKIEQAIIKHQKSSGASENWEYDIVMELHTNDEVVYKPSQGTDLRGFILPDSWFYDVNTGALRFDAEEAWGVSDFKDELKKLFPDINILYIVEEYGCEVYATNDQYGIYFKDRYFVDTCINDQYQSDYFQTEEEVYKWLEEITDGKVKCEEDVEAFIDDYEDSDSREENFINIHKFEVID